MRILIKMQNPIPISYIVEGFPNGSEDFVLGAINSLFNSGYVSYPYLEKNHITYKKEKRIEILRIIDPLPELGSEEDNELSSSPKEEIEVAASRKRENNSGEWYRTSAKRSTVTKVALLMSIFIFGIVSIFSNAVSTQDIYQNFKLVGNYYYHHENNPLFDSYPIGVSENTTRNYSLHNPEHLNTEEFADGFHNPEHLNTEEFADGFHNPEHLNTKE